MVIRSMVHIYQRVYYRIIDKAMKIYFIIITISNSKVLRIKKRKRATHKYLTNTDKNDHA